ncbi:MAG: YcgN family cysteine cluster protein [Thermodesulfobacteriota bacterium]
MTDNDDRPFWKIKPLSEMTHAEWESLCDGCGRCCLEKIEDPDTGAVVYTSVTCPHLDTWECRCGSYETRSVIEPECLRLTPHNLESIQWMPLTCAYRYLAEGKELEWWHPLVSGRPESVHEAGISVRNKVISGCYVLPEQLEAYAIDADI